MIQKWSKNILFRFFQEYFKCRYLEKPLNASEDINSTYYEELSGNNKSRDLDLRFFVLDMWIP